MTKAFSRRAFLGSVASLAAFPACANVDRSLRPVARGEDLAKAALSPIDALLGKARLGNSAQVAFSVADTRTGLVLEKRNETKGVPPASVAKALTAAYAITVLGEDHRFQTRVIAVGTLANGILDGDLILAGGGNPVLNSDHLARLAGDMKAAGLREVRGRFLVWGGAVPFSRVIDPGQPDHVGYSPAVSGMTLNYNRVHFEWRKGNDGWRVTMDGRSEKHRPDVQFATMRVVSRSLPVYTYEDKNNKDVWTVAQGALGNGGARWLPVRRPELYAGEVFQTFARANGIVLKSPGVVQRLPEGQVLARHDSPKLSVIAREMLRYSTNITAELIGLAATAQLRGQRAKSLKDSAGEMNAWARKTYGVPAMKLVDHSGLGDASRMTASDMVTVLIKVREALGLKVLMKDIPMRDGQRRIIKNHPVKVRAKTGTLNYVSGLAGYLDAPDGSELAFAIFAADTKTRAAIKKADREKPKGARSWNRRARILQQDLIDRWGILYGT